MCAINVSSHNVYYVKLRVMSDSKRHLSNSHIIAFTTYANIFNCGNQQPGNPLCS